MLYIIKVLSTTPQNCQIHMYYRSAARMLEVICKPLSQKNSVEGCLQLWYHVIIFKYKLFYSSPTYLVFYIASLQPIFELPYKVK